MKKLITGICILSSIIASAQSYEQQMQQAGEALQKKDFCNALLIFKTALADTAKAGMYDFAYGALAAANCNAEKLALDWLKKSRKKGLGLNEGEIQAITNDSGFMKLHSYAEWNDFVNAMKQAFLEKQKVEKKRSDDWLATIHANRIKQSKNGKFNTPRTGFALYSTTVDSLNVPYLVFVPQKYNPIKPSAAIVYLHGGIVHTENFNFSHPEIQTGEPIFSVADSLNAIVIYPFGKKDFGWVSQKKAFENIITVVKQVKQLYNINAQKLFLGGTSNGGTAAFWFASQNPSMFKGFYAFSAMPRLETDSINFNNLSGGKPFYTMHSKEDDVFTYDEVYSIYLRNRAAAKDWHFETIEKGNHGFIYDPQQGKELMMKLLKKLFDQ